MVVRVVVRADPADRVAIGVVQVAPVVVADLVRAVAVAVVATVRAAAVAVATVQVAAIDVQRVAAEARVRIALGKTVDHALKAPAGIRAFNRRSIRTHPVDPNAPIVDAQNPPGDRKPRRQRKPIGPDASGLGPDGQPWDPDRRRKRIEERQAAVNAAPSAPVEAPVAPAPVQEAQEAPKE